MNGIWRSRTVTVSGGSRAPVLHPSCLLSTCSIRTCPGLQVRVGSLALGPSRFQSLSSIWNPTGCSCSSRVGAVSLRLECSESRVVTISIFLHLQHYTAACCTIHFSSHKLPVLVLHSCKSKPNQLCLAPLTLIPPGSNV